MLVEDFSAIGKKLYSFRKKMGLTQVEVADSASLSTRTYADIERGSVNMRVETLLRICKVLRITPNDILTTDDISIARNQDKILNQLETCSPKDKETAFSLLATFLESLNT